MIDIILLYVLPMIITLSYFLFYGDEDVKDLERLLFSRYIFLWILPVFNLFGAFIAIIIMLDDKIEDIDINIKTPKIIQRILDFKIPIRKTK